MKTFNTFDKIFTLLILSEYQNSDVCIPEHMICVFVNKQGVSVYKQAVLVYKHDIR